jgi:AP-3 complex subunit mu
VVDVLEDFLGAPLLASKIEGNYDVVAQLLVEMCDAGAVSNTEPNALRDVVEVPGWVGRILGTVSLPGYVLAQVAKQRISTILYTANRFKSTSLSSSASSSLSLQHQALQPPVTQLPWRRANVRHTSNELYVDLVESLAVTLAPSGRPLSARANGTIAMTAKISGFPDLLLTLSTPGGKSNIEHALELPVFHPCVRLARWRERPGELSFVPPDGRFVLAGYEANLLPFNAVKGPTSSAPNASNLQLPVKLEVRKSLGPIGADFEVRLFLTNSFPGWTVPPALGRASGLGSRLGTSSPAFGGSSNAPMLDEVVVSIPIPEGVKNLTDLRTSRGDAQYSPGDRFVEWRVPTTGGASATTGHGGATLRCSVVGIAGDEDEDEGPTFSLEGVGVREEYILGDAYQSAALGLPQQEENEQQRQQRDLRRIQQNATLMPSSANVSFTVKGWLSSGVKVDSLIINTRASKGLGEGVKPYKGVKYLTVSKGGVEVRC